MNTNNLAEIKMSLFQKIMDVENEKALNTLNRIIDKVLSNQKSGKETDFNGLSFEEWNSLFMQEKDLDEYLPEYEMTLGEYRKKIFEAEKSPDYPIEHFLDKLTSYAQ